MNKPKSMSNAASKLTIYLSVISSIKRSGCEGKVVSWMQLMNMMTGKFDAESDVGPLLRLKIDWCLSGVKDKFSVSSLVLPLPPRS